MERRPGYVGPLLLITLGLILLFNKLGLISLSWRSLWFFWPVILILIGIEILARHTESGFMYFAGIVLSILIIIGTILLALNGYPAPDKTGKDQLIDKSRLAGNDLNFADLDNADFSNSGLNGINMNFASLHRANFSNSNLDGANMNFADLRYAKLDGTGLNGANLNFADMRNTDLSNAVLDGANMNFVDLDGANMSGASLNGTSHVFAGTSRNTICPDSRNGPCW